METPLISVIIPVYNVESYLPQCIDSLLAQSYSNFEMILVDDGSPDSSGKICDEYAAKDPRITIIHQENQGVSIARNNGIDVAKGEWITFVDSDDWVAPDYLSDFKPGSDDADLIIQGLEYYNHKTKTYFSPIKVNDCTVDGPNIKQIVADNNLLGLGYPVAKAYKKSLLKKGIRFNVQISYHEDHIFVLETINKATNIRLVNSVAYKYRYYHTNSSLSTKRHPWNNLNIAADGMIGALNSLHEKFLDSGSIYERKIYNFAYGPKIDAVFQLFRTGISRKEKKIYIATIIKKNDLIKYYNPFSFKDIVIKTILQSTPFVVQYLFFSAYTKYQDRSK